MQAYLYLSTEILFPHMKENKLINCLQRKKKSVLIRVKLIIKGQNQRIGIYENKIWEDPEQQEQCKRVSPEEKMTDW